MNNKDIFRYGEEILNCINKAAESGDFSNLGRDISSFVGDAAKGFSKGGYKGPVYKKAEYRELDRDYKGYSPEMKASAGYDIGAEIRDTIESNIRNALPRRQELRTPFFSTRINRSKGIGKIVAGSLVTVYGSLCTLACLVVIPVGADLYAIFIVFLVIGLVMLATGLGLLKAGMNNRKLIKNYFRFGQIAGTRPYVELRELADKTGLAPNDIVRQIKQMKKRGYLPYATIDSAETTLMLTDEVYKEYTKSVQYNAEKPVEKPKPKPVKEETSTVKYYTIDEDLPEEVKDILEEGNDYLNKIRYYNDLIPDTETMSDKLYTLEATVLSIFKKLKEEPEIAGDLRKFMSYYLPTTEKLLQSYVDLRKENLSVENIKNSQKEIEEATDVINDAFVKLLNQLFESAAWDISSDISVMKTMMKQDSLL